MHARDEIGQLTDEVLTTAEDADAAELFFEGGERSGTRRANSTITANLIQFDQRLTAYA